METKPIETLTVMFADVAGSTKLYEQLGDVIANSIISEVIQLMQNATKLHNGIVVKTIGDEVMCRFSSANDCANAAVLIQEKLQLGMVQGQFVAVRIGFHSGPAIIQDDGDIFGDTVNTAARMADAGSPSMRDSSPAANFGSIVSKIGPAFLPPMD